MILSDVDRAILGRHVTNIDGNVYCLTNLPEEVVAVIFAYVSRSDRSFKENLLRLIKQGDLGEPFDEQTPPTFASAVQKASDFHSRWVISYGHSSIAEHAVAHVGVERISRLASAELELANKFLSFTEYSQRYQKPRRGEYYIPKELDAHLLSQYRQSMEALYDTYEQLYQGLVSYLDDALPEREGETSTARQGRIDRLAFEDARYALPLSTLTSLGMTGNGRALRDAIALLGASVFGEVRQLADDLREEITKVLPSLLRHASPSDYQLRWCPSWHQLAGSASKSSGKAPSVQLLRFTGQDTDSPEETARQIVAQVAAASGVHIDKSCEPLEAMIADMGPHDVPPPAFHWIRYDCLFTLSEAAWHQLLRHCRGMHFQWGPPEISNGYTVPPNIGAAGLTDLLDQAIAVSEDLYKLLEREAPATAGYAVINAHRRRVRSEFDLWQLYHLVNLRTTPEAQWDIRNIVTELWEQILAVHPRLASRAQRRC
ncbi:MAG: FAD-dependent thymidylate synthase [Firmicutes bacterium]|nr:FAD-dependent thymidylate synthase [Bacillota bacterium]